MKLKELCGVMENKTLIHFRDLSSKQLCESVALQQYLIIKADVEYDAWVNKQKLSEWWQKNLWNKLNFIIKEE